MAYHLESLTKQGVVEATEREGRWGGGRQDGGRFVAAEALQHAGQLN